MVCHGELYRLRPAPAGSPAFYLAIAAGGALGGLFVALVAPVFFTYYYELHWGMFVCAALLVLVCCTENTALLPGREAAEERRTPDETQPGSPSPRGELQEAAVAASPRPRLQWPLLACALPLVGFGGLDLFMCRIGERNPGLSKTIPHQRAGCGLGLCGLAGGVLVCALAVPPAIPTLAAACLLWLLARPVAPWVSRYGPRCRARRKSDRICAFAQFLRHVERVRIPQGRPGEALLSCSSTGGSPTGCSSRIPEQATWPTSYYYGHTSGVALAVNASLPATAAWAWWAWAPADGGLWPGGRLRAVLRDQPGGAAAGQLPVHVPAELRRESGGGLGDARLSMEREPPQKFDLLALDAFSGDAIPVHLLTREAFELYHRIMKPNGVIAVHISNHYLDLQPVVVNLARDFNYQLAVIDYDENEEEWWLYLHLGVVTHDPSLLAAPEIAAATTPAETRTALAAALDG